MSLMSILNPTAKSIQKEYVEKRKRQLFKNDDKKTEAVKKKIESLHELHKVTADWYDTYSKITARLMSASLTINFDAVSWFSGENHYGTYAQMYERATKDGKMVLKDTGLNPALSRAMVDDLVTIPDDWAQSHRFSQRRRLRDALHATGTSQDHLAALGNPDQAARPKMHGSKESGYKTSNKLFKPKAKQVFAALNYGRRAHGSTTAYGFSHLVLKPELRYDALYYAGDTFYRAGLGAAGQATYNTLGALLERSTRKFDQDLWKSCYEGHHLMDTSDGDLLLEAHIFKTLKVAEDVQALVLSRTPLDTTLYLPDVRWREIVKNATKWCTKNNVRLDFST